MAIEWESAARMPGTPASGWPDAWAGASGSSDPRVVRVVKAGRSSRGEEADALAERLLEAIRKGDAAEARRALEAGALPDYVGSGHLTPLALAARLNQAECAEAVVEALAAMGPGSLRAREGSCVYPSRVSSEEQLRKGVSALQEAARNGSTECARVFVQRGWDLEETGVEGRTALAWACERGHAATARELIRLGARVANLSEEAAEACWRSDIEVIRVLLESGFDASKRSASGYTGLMIAARKGNERALRLFIEHGADLDATCEKDKGDTALHMAARHDAVECARELLKAGADPEALNSEGWRPLDVSRPVSKTHPDDDEDEYGDAHRQGEPNDAGQVIQAFLEARQIEAAASAGRPRSPGSRL